MSLGAANGRQKCPAVARTRPVGSPSIGYHSSGGEPISHDLSEICAERNPDPADQRRRLVEVLAAGADVHAADKNGVTALHHAVRFRSPAAVRTLIEHGADVNRACRRSGSTPLHRAVTSTGAPGSSGRQAEAREIIELLLAAGADPSIGNRHGKRPADYTRDERIRTLLTEMPGAEVTRRRE